MRPSIVSPDVANWKVQQTFYDLRMCVRVCFCERVRVCGFMCERGAYEGECVLGIFLWVQDGVRGRDSKCESVKRMFDDLCVCMMV